MLFSLTSFVDRLDSVHRCDVVRVPAVDFFQFPKVAHVVRTQVYGGVVQEASVVLGCDGGVVAESVGEQFHVFRSLEPRCGFLRVELVE